MERFSSEEQEQIAFCQWMKREHPGVKFFHVPNGGLRSKATAMRMKALGTSPGVPDIVIPKWRMFIEFKRVDGGSTSAAQKEWIEHLTECGYTAFVAHGCEDAKRQILSGL